MWFSKRTWIWIGSVAVAVVLLLGIGINWLVGRYLSAEGLSQQLSRLTHREVRVKSVDFSLWDGIRLGEITVSNYPDRSEGTMVTANSVSLTPEWGPLIYGRVRIHRVQIHQPRLYIHRGSDGTWNFNRGMEPPGETEKPADQPTGRTQDGLDLAIQRITFTGARVQYVDEKLGFKRTFEAKHLSVMNFKPNTGAGISVEELRIPGGTLSGRFDLNFSPVSLRINQSSVTIDHPNQLNELVKSLSGLEPGLKASRFELAISDGVVRPDSVSARVQMKARGISLNPPGLQEIHGKRIESTGRLKLNPRTVTGSLEFSPVSLTEVVVEPGMGIEGTLSGVDVEFTGTESGVRWGLNFTVGALSVRREQWSSPMKVTGGEARLVPGELSLKNVTLNRGSASLSGDVTLGRFNGGHPTISGKLSGENVTFSTVTDLLPAGLIPESLDWSGRVSSGTLSLSGTLYEPRLYGELLLGSARVQPTFLNEPLIVSGQTLTLAGEQIRVRNTPVSLGNISLSLDGSGRFYPPFELDFTAEISEVALSDVKSVLTQPLPLSDRWFPKASVSGELTVTGTALSPRLRGSFTSGRFRAGPIEGTNGRFHVNYENGSLGIEPFSMDFYGGGIEGGLQISTLFDRPSLKTNLGLENTNLGSLLSGVFNAGRGSEGRVSGTVSLSGSLGSMDSVDGRVTVSGDSIVLRHIPAVNDLGGAIVSGVSGAIGEKFGPVVSQLAGLSLAEPKQELRRVFDERVTSRFNTFAGSIQFENGAGRIHSTQLSNRYLSLKTDGRVWVDGRLNTTLSLRPKPPLLARAREDWLKNILESGLPPMNVNGRVMSPSFGVDKFQSRLARTLALSLLTGDGQNKKSKKEGPEKKLKKQLLKEILK